MSARKTILFVDDDAGFLETIERLFRLWSQEQIGVLVAHSTGQAISLLQNHPVDLVVIDVHMPVMDGLQFLTLLHRKYPNVQKAILTGFAEEPNRDACLRAGAGLFLEKPRTGAEAESVYTALSALVYLELERGFRGVLQEVGLHEVLQMKCLANKDCVLEVRGARETGEIYIEAGRIIHARVGVLTGPDAFYSLMSLRGGEFKVLPYVAPPEVTISVPWEHLLLESARKMDEANGVGGLLGTSPSGTRSQGVAAAAAALAAAVKAGGPPGQPPAPAPRMNGRTARIPLPSANPPRQPPAPAALPAAADFPAAADGLPAAAPARRDDHLPEELVCCRTDGEITLSWQAADADLRVAFLEFLTGKSAHLGRLVGVGAFDRLEIQGSDLSAVAALGESENCFARSSSRAGQDTSALSDFLRRDLAKVRSQLAADPPRKEAA